MNSEEAQIKLELRRGYDSSEISLNDGSRLEQPLSEDEIERAETQAAVIFDADDVIRIMRRFTAPELQTEASHAEAHATAARSRGDLAGEIYFREYASACRLAADILTAGLGPRPGTIDARERMVETRALKSAMNILAVASRYTALKKVGSIYKGLCPIHQERKPSFCVWPEEGRWHCFGACGRGGDVISLVMGAENLSFKEAIENLKEGRAWITHKTQP